MDFDKSKKFYLEAKIKVHEETPALKEAASKVITLPKGKDKQPDLLYFSALFVSSGTNLNDAHFMPSELVLAEGTIVNKALDIEHKEEAIIGHLYDRAFVDTNYNEYDVTELSNTEKAAIDKKDLHVLIAGIVYKNRFPELAKEIEEDKWKVSMEAYYKDYDLKVGDLILSRDEAAVLGFTSSDMVGKAAKVVKNNVEVARGKIARVLRGILFSGCGIVKNPANPPSVVLETANEEELIVLEDKGLSGDTEDENENIDTTERGSQKEDTTQEASTEVAMDSLEHDDTVGICVNYKRRVTDSGHVQGPDSKVLHTDWCSAYEMSCTSASRDTTDPNCLRVRVPSVVRACFASVMQERSCTENLLFLRKALDRAKHLF